MSLDQDISNLRRLIQSWLYSLHGMVHSSHTGAHPQPFRSLKRKLAVINDNMRCQFRMSDSRLHAILISIPSTKRALGSTQCSRDTDMMQKLAWLLLIQAIAYSFRRINGATTTNRDYGINRVILHDKLRRLIQLLDRCMLSNLAECAGMPRSQLLFHLLDQRGLGRQRRSGKNECL